MPESTRHILVVDDEQDLLRLLQLFLTRQGYRVTSCVRAMEAVGAFAAAPEEFAAVIADLSMPDLPGLALLHELVAIRRTVRVLLCSGYPFDVKQLALDLQPQVAFVAKPFTPQALLRELAALLAR